MSLINYKKWWQIAKADTGMLLIYSMIYIPFIFSPYGRYPCPSPITRFVFKATFLFKFFFIHSVTPSQYSVYYYSIIYFVIYLTRTIIWHIRNFLKQNFILNKSALKTLVGLANLSSSLSYLVIMPWIYSWSIHRDHCNEPRHTNQYHNID